MSPDVVPGDAIGAWFDVTPSDTLYGGRRPTFVHIDNPRDPRYPKTCRHCLNRFTNREKNLLKCGRCGVARYCSVDCQRNNWAKHKNVECDSLRDARANNGQ